MPPDVCLYYLNSLIFNAYISNSKWFNHHLHLVLDLNLKEEILILLTQILHFNV